MPIYRVANKKIIISPKSKFKDSVKYFYAFILTGLFAILIKIFIPSYSEGQTIDLIAQESAVEKEAGIARTFDAGGTESLNVAKVGSEKVLNGGNGIAVSGYLGMDVWAWFLLGAWVTILIFFVINIFNERKI